MQGTKAYCSKQEKIILVPKIIFTCSEKRSKLLFSYIIYRSVLTNKKNDSFLGEKVG